MRDAGFTIRCLSKPLIRFLPANPPPNPSVKPIRNPYVRVSLSLAFSLMSVTTSSAINLYWDVNGVDENTGSSGTGAWNGTNAFWNTEVSGTGGTPQAGTTGSDLLHFSSGTGLTAGTVTVSAGRLAGGLVFEESGVYSLTGGNITLSGATGISYSSGTGANTIASALILGANSIFENLDDTTQTITGGVTGAYNLTLHANNAGGLTFSTGALNNAGTITNSGSGTNTVTINSQIGSNVTSVIQNSATSKLSIFGTGGVAGYGNLTVKAGTVELRSNLTTPIAATAPIYLGDTAANTADVTLVFQGTSATFASPIILESGTTGKITIGGLNTGTAINFTGGITGTNNLEINTALGTSANTGVLTISGGSLNFTGTLTHVTGDGTGTTTSTDTSRGMVVIDSVIGANVTGVIQNSASVYRVMRLNGDNQYAGATTVTRGILAIGHNNALGTAAGDTSVAAGATLRIHNNITVTGETLTLTGSGSGNLVDNRDGNNEWAGSIAANVAAGHVRISSTGGHLELSGPVGLSGNSSNGLVLTGTADGEVSGNITQSGTGSKALIKTGSGTWTVSGTNSYSGNTQIYAGTLSVDSIDSRLGTSTGAIQLGEASSNGRLLYTGNATGDKVRGISLRATNGTGGGIIEHAGTGHLVFSSVVSSNNADATVEKTLTLRGSTSGTGEITGAISDSSGDDKTNIVKDGTGTWTLSGVSGYTGTTRVNEGQLIVSGKLNATTELSVTNATFTYGANDVVNNAAKVTLGAGAVVQTGIFSDALGALVLTGAAELALGNGNSKITFLNSVSEASNWSGLLSITGWTGLLTGNGDEQVLFTEAGLTVDQLGQIVFVDPQGLAPGTYGAMFIGSEIVPIPEPSVLVAGAVGMLGMAVRRRRVSV